MSAYQTILKNFHYKSSIVFLCIVQFLAFSEVYAQNRGLSDRFPANRWSFEVKYGGGFPLSHARDKDSVKYYNRSLSSYAVGARYMISHTIGIRSSYHHHYFASSDQQNPTLRTHTFLLEGVYSFSTLFPEGRISKPRKWNVLAHAGAGYTLGFFGDKSSKDRIISGILGATLQYRPINYLAFSFEPFTFQFNSFQDKGISEKDNFAISSDLLVRLFKPEVFWYPSIGVQLYFGKWHQHLDWR